jgi:hypothetical protein
MAWKYGHKTIRLGRGWTDNDGIQHPANWGSWSDEQKTAAGLVWDASATPAPYDNRFWWDADTPKNINDVNEVDSDNNPILDENGNQLVTLGLKSVWKNLTKERAGNLLAPTDWMVVKAAEVSGYTVPADITTYRAAVRTASNTIEAAIDAVNSHPAFLALHDAPVDADGNVTGNAPINDWPDEV